MLVRTGDGWARFDDYDHRFPSIFFSNCRGGLMGMIRDFKMKIINRWIEFFNLNILVKKSILCDNV